MSHGNDTSPEHWIVPERLTSLWYSNWGVVVPVHEQKQPQKHCRAHTALSLPTILASSRVSALVLSYKSTQK